MAMIEEREGGVMVEVSVRPKAGKSMVVGVVGGRIRIDVRSAPEKGEATLEAMQTIAKRIGRRSEDVELVKGKTSRHKTFFIKGATLKDFEEII